MRINWLDSDSAKVDVDVLIRTEYKFRSRITRILLDRMQDYSENDLENISFDFDICKKSFKISSNTPEPIYSKLLGIEHLLFEPSQNSF